MTYGMYCSLFLTAISIICIFIMKKIQPEVWKVYTVWVALVLAATIGFIYGVEGWG